MEPSNRKQRILAAIVELYNETGEPVGSKRLAEVLSATEALSSATIRNEMAQLSEHGYLEQPHTSAGRVPSPLGYRYYLDHLLPLRELSREQRARLEAQLRERAREPERLLENASEILADLTGCTAMCVPGEQVQIKRIEVAPLGRTMAMLALLTTGGTVKSKVVRTEAPLTAETLEAFYALIETHVVGMPADRFRCGPAQVQSLAAKAGPHFLAVAPLLAGVMDLAQAAGGREVLAGETRLGPAPVLPPLLHYLKQNANPTQLKVVLGAEADPSARGVTMVVAPYAIGQAQGGLLAIVGSIRMDYAGIIPSLQFIAALLGKFLENNAE
ncbi:MAG: heat-inducible transcriptional repressor HrcA [Oscillospiraceae bacterium]|nr:heat-inducible transcriptional repressor HrcA [Oscillospiraceae bacterium]